MTQNYQPKTTQRAYTLKLRGTDPLDTAWRDAVWRTHEAVNKGAQVFGNWLLTLRGGLDHRLAEDTADRKLEETERKNRRIMLALSWLSVESERGAPKKYRVASGTDLAKTRSDMVLKAFVEILRKKGLDDPEIEQWKRDCASSLEAAIREDAVWVNRSQAYAELAFPVSDKDIWDLLERFFGTPEAYLKAMKSPDEEGEDGVASGTTEEKAKDLVQKAGQWLSSRFGTGAGADFARMAKVYDAMAAWGTAAKEGHSGTETIADLAQWLSEFKPESDDVTGVLNLISGPGYKSATRNCVHELGGAATVDRSLIEKFCDLATKDAENSRAKTGSKGPLSYANAILENVEGVAGFTYRSAKDGTPVSVRDYSSFPEDYKWGTARHSEFAVILDHAARRVSLAHTWIKIAEGERRSFEENAAKISSVPENIKQWLDSFCEERSKYSGALDAYRIGRRALGGWKEVVAAWSKPECQGCEDRIDVARTLQSDPEIKKFGDIQLFEALAQEDALCVWHKNGDVEKASDPQPLLDYAAASDAEFKKRRFKVPAYRHPDALLHPVFCDFGNSRWKIQYNVHKPKGKASQTLPQDQVRGLSMNLLTGTHIKALELKWQSKRLAQDLAIDQPDGEGEVVQLSRADRLGRSVGDAGKDDKIQIIDLFDQKDWNGRLQAPRRQLNAMAAVRDNPKLSDEERRLRLEKMQEQLQWLITFSAKLQPQGPWHDYRKKLQLKGQPDRFPFAEENKGRKGTQAKLILSRLPGLRVLSVDLGHRYAAACAVWETLSSEAMTKACAAAGHKPPAQTDLYLHLKEPSALQKKGLKTARDRTVVYRRIAADLLPDGKVHPAPWARLDRQFLIKLQGEEEGVRKASHEEIGMVNWIEYTLGRTSPLIDKLVASGWGSTNKQKMELDAWKKQGRWIPSEQDTTQLSEEERITKPSLSVDDLMADTVRTMTLALRRHSDRARIAHYLITHEKTRPGGQKLPLDDKGRVDIIVDALVLWNNLCTMRWWKDEKAKTLWSDLILPLAPDAVKKIDEEADLKRSPNQDKKRREALKPVAEYLFSNPALAEEIAAHWKKRWEEDDELWKKLLRSFGDWILGKHKGGNHPSLHKMGGLSVKRIATLTEFRRKVQVGFYTRLHPDGTKREIKEQFGQKSLNALEQLREQRVKQLASRIAEAALGVGRIRRAGLILDPKRPQTRVDATCHAVVIEDLTNYRPEQTRTRRENRGVMAWASSKVKKYLEEACILHGLHFREIYPAYTSRQDSRTGAPGMRCQDVPLKDFIGSVYWKNECLGAGKKKDSPRQQYLMDLYKKWELKQDAAAADKVTLRVPMNGAELFVSVDPASPAAKGLQADLNAAANIGLRALLDPDWPGRWWYVPCNAKDDKPDSKKVGGSEVFKGDLVLPKQGDHDLGATKGTAKKPAAAKDIVNLWRDASALPVAAEEAGLWRSYQDYYKDVEKRVVRILQEQMDATWKAFVDEEDIPY